MSSPDCNLGHSDAMRCLSEGPVFASWTNRPGGSYNFTWMVQTLGRQMPDHANMWRISQDIGRCVWSH